MGRNLFSFLITSLGWCGLALAQAATVVPGEYIVKLKGQSGFSQQGARAKLASKAAMKAAYPNMGMYHISLKASEDAASSLEDIQSDPDVEYVEPNYVWQAVDVAASSNSAQGFTLQTLVTSYGVSQGSSDYSQFSQTAVANTQVAASWTHSASLASNSGKIVVAIVDSGLDRTHKVFLPYASDGTGGTGALWVNTIEASGQTGVDDDGNGYVDDINGWNFVSNNANVNDDNNHGTHVAGIVVGAGLNIFARPLDESKIQVMPVKSLNADGSGTTATAIKAIYYAVDNGARIINNSWGGSNYSQALADALSSANDHGVLIVNAAGNYSSNNDSVPMYPANYNIASSLSIASVNTYDQRSSFSNYGKNTVHLGSPGESILSTVPGGNYNYMSGTSMATPFVAGVAALSLREDSALTGYQLKQRILSSLDIVSSLNNVVSTSGRIDADNLIQTVQASIGEGTYSFSKTDRSIASTESAGGAAGCGLVSTAIHDGPGTGGANPTAGVIFGLMAIPMIVWFVMRQRAMALDPRNRRRHDRFRMSSQIKVMVGDRELVGSMNSISQGGLSFNTDQALEKGGIVTMRIQSPDGHEVIEVQGQVVWSEANQSYGVQFANAKTGTLAMIQQWTSNLVKS